MISFSLLCSNQHDFDGWFRSNDDFDAQCAKGLIFCPVCGDTDVRKALMAPRVSTTRSKQKAAQEVHQAMVAAQGALASDQKAPVDGEVLPAPSTAGAKPVASLKDAPAPVKAYVEAVRTLRKEIEANSEDVGDRFADEARKIHLGESEERAIRGEATLEEAAALDEEGIDVFVVPHLPEEGH